MLNYFWLNDRSPILSQLPQSFKSAALLLHPFTQMPQGWSLLKRENQSSHIFPSDKEILQLGKPVGWKNIMQDTGLSLKELAIGLQTYIGALNKTYAREDLVKRISSIARQDLYLPNEDEFPILLREKIFDVLCSKGAKFFTYHDVLQDRNEVVEVGKIQPIEIGDLAYKEVIIADENLDFAFMSMFDSVCTLFISKDENINEIIESNNIEAIICNENTYIDWYFH